MNGRIFPFAARAHDEAQRLLPWLVNGTLDADEHDWLLHHLEVCRDCQCELQEQRALQSACIDDATLAGDVEAGWERMQRRLAAPSRPAPVKWQDLWLMRWQQAPRWMAWTLVAQTMLLVVLGIEAWWPRAQPRTYHTLGAGSSSLYQAPGNLVIVFDPQLSEGQLRRLLAASDARIVNGPNDAGAYVLAVPPSRVESVRDALRAAPGVTLVESLAGAKQ
jgi:hypothetical protein